MWVGLASLQYLQCGQITDQFFFKMVAMHILLLPLIAYPALAFNRPSYMKPCGQNDPKLSECVVDNFRAALPHFINGSPKYGVPDLDPLIIPEIRIDEGTQQVGLKFIFTNVNCFGFENIKINGARTNLKDKHMEWDFTVDSGISLVGPYKASGKVLLLPITGDGMANITTEGLSFTYKFDYDFVNRKGKEYMNLVNTNYTYEFKRIHFQLDNLFNGDKALGDNMNRILNENWKELENTFGKDIVTAVNEAMFRPLLKRSIGLIPYNELFPDTKS